MAIIQTTIKDLRQFSGTPNLTDSYYVTDEGMEGFWKLGPAQTSLFTDNLGTILNTGWTYPTSGSPVPPTPSSTSPEYEFKRIYSGYVNVKWFGAKGDGINDDTEEIQNALNYISKIFAGSVSTLKADWNHWDYGGGTLFFPQGQYIISSTLYIGQHTRILGVSKGGDFFPYNPVDTGTVFKCEFENLDSWALESDCRWTEYIPPLVPPFPAPPNQIWKGDRIEYTSFVSGFDFDNLRITTNLGIVVEGIYFDCLNVIKVEGQPTIYKQLFGGIRLLGSPNSLIKNCAILNPKSAVMLSSCWNTNIDNLYSVSTYYGVIVCDCNVVKVGESYIQGQGYKVFSEEDTLPNFIYPDYAGLDNNLKRQSTGIYIRGGSSIAIDTCPIENFNIGVFSTWATTSFTSLYLEGHSDPELGSFMYGVVMTGPNQTIMNQTKLVKLKAGFYLGEGPELIVNNVSLTGDVEVLYVPNDPAYRSVRFNQVRLATAPLSKITGKRSFKNDIIFEDEITDTVFVDSTNPDNRYNLGFSESDPVYSFDDALIRLQYSQRKVKRILILGGTTAIKDENERYLNALDLLISSYGESEVPASIYFDGTNQLGQMSIRGSVKLTFRGINLVCNNTTPTSYDFNASIFRLNLGYFELFLENVNVDLKDGYSLAAADYSAGSLSKSFIQTRWVNVFIDGSAQARLSPYQWNSKCLAVDCIQYNGAVSTSIASMPNKGWDDSEIINNNL